jgi:ferritin-like metal-binding protein YciE/tetratricopeptide (TPR) repeat protein
MSRSEQKIVQYLDEAHASEIALVRVLQSQIAMTPRGTYRSALETHLDETRRHAARVQTRLAELSGGRNPLQFLGGVVQTVAGQALALAKTPLDLVRGSGGEEKVLKNAKDACATEALEIATYTAIERLARSVGDDQTAKLAASIRADEEKMLDRIMRELPKLTAAVVGADVEDDPSYDLTKTGAADTARATGKAAAKTARNTGAKAKRGTRQARKLPGVAQAEGQVKGAVASQSDLAIAGYDKRTAEEIVAKLSELSQIELAKVDAYERKHENRTTVLDRISTLRGDEPWPGYDELTVSEIQTALREADDDRVKAVRAYERAHKARTGVLNSTERRIGTPSGDDSSPADAPARVTGADAGSDAQQALQAAADAGDGAAAYTLWEQLREADSAAAEGWLRRAADLGDSRAAHRLGLLLWERREVDAAEETLRNATDEPEGSYALGRLLWQERNEPEAAVQWLDRAAQTDHAAAERDLGIVLREHGDLQGAHYWLSRAAERDGEARQVLAELGADR